MKRIGLLSDTHGWYDPKIEEYLAQCDEIWHCGDIGSTQVADRLAAFKPLRAVYGNVDGYETRLMFSKFLSFQCEDVNVLMTHIGGYPGRYDSEARQQIYIHKPTLFVCGHSHILKVQYDKQYEMLTMNPGAFGNQGFHQVRTLLRFQIEGTNIENLEVVELPRFIDSDI